MYKYKCKICGYIYEEEKEFESLNNDFVCPMCGVPKYLFEKINAQLEEKKEEICNFVKISKDNPSIKRIDEKCISCGMCKSICLERENIKNTCDGDICVNCGQCIQFCPTMALIPKVDAEKLKEAKKKKKILIAYTSPGVRVSIGDEFGIEKGKFEKGKLISALRKLGFDYVFDVTFSADLTIMEEANELINRINKKETLPMFTSCCPSWVKYAEIFYPEILPNISTCKSPIGMMGEVVKNYFTLKNNIDKKNIFTVAITPCTSKKYEILRPDINGTNLVITIKELSDLIKSEKIDFINLEDSEYDELLKEGSGAGTIFGNTGGVMEAALREVNYILTGKKLEKIEYNEVRGMENIKEATININNLKLNVAVIHEMSSAISILEEIKKGTSKYHYIEIMNCKGGCIGGGGQPKIVMGEENIVKEKRIQTLYERDKNSNIIYPHENPDIKRIYNEFLGKPFGEKSKELLHTKYEDKSNILNKLKEKVM